MGEFRTYKKTTNMPQSSEFELLINNLQTQIDYLKKDIARLEKQIELSNAPNQMQDEMMKLVMNMISNQSKIQ